MNEQATSIADEKSKIGEERGVATQAVNGAVSTRDRQSSAIEVRSTILILGMHRSGTSALSRVLNLMGMDLGEDLLPPAADNNETGFWEHRILQWINRRIFECLGREWDSVLPLPARWLEQPQLHELRNELKQVIEGEFGSSPLWGLKDPRVCFLLPLWRPLLEDLRCIPKCVLTFRNPIEVARSLQKRDGLPMSQCYLMWLRSLLESERDSRGMVRTLTTYDLLMEDWKTQMQQIGRDLQINWPVSTAEVAPAVEEFLQPSLRHHQIDNQKLLEDVSVPQLVRQAYAAILDAAGSGAVGDLSSPFDSIAAELAMNHPMITQYIGDVGLAYSVTNQQKTLEKQRYETELADAAKHVSAAQAALAAEQLARIGVQTELLNTQRAVVNVQAELVNEQAQLSAVQAALFQEQTAVGAARKRIAEWEVHATELDADRHRLRAQLTAKIQQLEQDIHRLTENVANQNESIAGQKHLIAQQNAQLNSVKAELAGYIQQRTALLEVTRQVWDSRSWRWTTQLRKLSKTVLTEKQLIAASLLQNIGENRWRSEGAASFILPCLPIVGTIHIRMKMKTAAPSQVLLYFDTGRFFNDEERIDLGNADGIFEIDQTHVLPKPVCCFRFDPLQTSAEFHIERFEIHSL